jgi:hypothetical protein
MNQYIIIHLHNHGYTTFRVNSYRDLGQDDVPEIVDKCDVCFEPLKGETIEIVKLYDNDEEFFLN